MNLLISNNRKESNEQLIFNIYIYLMEGRGEERKGKYNGAKIATKEDTRGIKGSCVSISPSDYYSYIFGIKHAE